MAIRSRSRCATASSPSTAASWRRRLDAIQSHRTRQESAMPHSISDDEAPPVAAGAAADAAALEAENASMRERMLRALADAENTRRRAERTAEDARQFAVSDFA